MALAVAAVIVVAVVVVAVVVVAVVAVAVRAVAVLGSVVAVGPMLLADVSCWIVGAVASLGHGGNAQRAHRGQ